MEVNRHIDVLAHSIPEDAKPAYDLIDKAGCLHNPCRPPPKRSCLHGPEPCIQQGLRAGPDLLIRALAANPLVDLDAVTQGTSQQAVYGQTDSLPRQIPKGLLNAGKGTGQNGPTPGKRHVCTCACQ